MGLSTHIVNCPACGGAIFWDVLVRFGPPFNRLLPVYLVNVVLDEYGSPVMWEYQGRDLADALDTDAEGFEHTTDPVIYCEQYHPVRGLVLGATLARLREPTCAPAPASVSEDRAAAVHGA